MKVNTAIIDDSQADIRSIKEILNAISETAAIHFSITSYSDPMAYDVNHVTDALFILDIDMKQLSGFDLAKRIQEHASGSRIIFCSCHEDMVFGSFQLNTFYFVRKSHLQEDFINAVRKLMTDIEESTSGYCCKEKNKNELIPWSSIMYFEVSGNYLYIHTKSEPYRTERKTMKSLLKELPLEGFVQTSNSDVVNLYYAISVSAKELTLEGGIRFPIPRNRASEIKRYYLEYQARH